jgi:hypothetical protein
MMATKNPFQGTDVDPFEGARDEEGGIKKEAAKKPSFGQAFAEARKAGEKTFMFNGKKYSTARADDKKSPPPTPSLSASKQRDLDMTESRRAGQDNMRAIKASQAARAKPEDAAGRPGPTKARAEMESRQQKDIERAADKRFVKDVVRGSEAAATRKKAQTYAKGGSVSARADGIAKRGKTKCKII